MEIKGETFEVSGDLNTATITFKGSMRLRGTEEYAHIVEMMNDLADRNPCAITLNLESLNFLNSSGINMLFGFVIRIRDQARCKLLVRGNQAISWQTKSLPNLKRLVPDLVLELATAPQ